MNARRKAPDSHAPLGIQTHTLPSLPQVVLNFIGFLCFSVPPQCGERLGLGITALFSPAVRCVVEGHPRAFSEPILGAARRRGVRLCHQRQAPGCIRNDMVRAMPSVSRSWQDPQTLTFLGPCYARFAQFSAFRCACRGDRLPGCLAPTHPPHPLLQPRLRHVGARRIMHRHQPLPQDLQVAPATLSALGEPMRGGSGRSQCRGPTPRS